MQTKKDISHFDRIKQFSDCIGAPSYSTLALFTMEEDTNRTLDLSRRSLKKVPKEESAQSVRCLILDENELQKIDNIDSYLRIETLSIARNQLLRMYGVCRLHNLRDLNLSYNGILTIEGLKELQHLVRLNLTGNNIKTIEHLQTNQRLQYLNLNDNSITNVGDLSFLRDLRELHLNGNRISHLRQCDKYLPPQLTALDLGRNNLTDLNEICTLVGLVSLNSIVIADNPCVQMVGPVANGFDYRPFVLNWCMTLQIIDGFAVTPIESLKAEWLYSQGRGRQFRVGEQAPLARYLASSCPLNAEALESDSERKLRLILSKAQQHQKQLQDEILNPDASLTTSMNSTSHNSPGSGRRRGVSHRIQSPRFQSRIGVTARQGSPPDSMISSYHGNTSGSALDVTPSFQMSTSLIENIKKSSSAADVMSQSLDLNQFRNNGGNPLAAASKMMPVPESLMSPDCGPAMVATAAQMLQSSRNAVAVNNRMGSVVKRDSNKTMSPKLTRPNQMSGVRKTSSSSMVATASSPPSATSPRRATSATGSTKSSSTLVQSTQPANSRSSDDEDDDGEVFNEDKLRTIRDKAAMKTLQHQNRAPEDEKCSAILIQKMWRGYYARKQLRDMVEQIHKQRTNEYIKKLTCDMEVTKEALENERKIQQLQMQAINALWKKVSAMQGGKENSQSKVVAVVANGEPGIFDNGQVVQDLAQTCSLLTNQVQQLQGSMRDILSYMSMFANIAPPPSQGGVDNNNVAEKIPMKSGECQTEIVAVHTPQADQLPFPFQSTKLPRPSTLPLDKKLAEDVNAEEASEENLEKIVRAAAETSEANGTAKEENLGEAN